MCWQVVGVSYPSDLIDEQWQKLARFTADTAYKRQAECVARERLGVELHITAKPKKP